MPEQGERGWLPDLLYTGGKFETGTAMFAGANGIISRFSKQPEDLAKAHPLPGVAMLPGMINAHSHSFQRVIRGRTERRTGAARDTFWTWRNAMYHAASNLSPEDIGIAARMAFLEMLLSGITAVGEFHYLHHQPDGTPYENRNLTSEVVIEAAREVGLRIALLRTAYVRAGWNKPADPLQARFVTADPDNFLGDTERLSAALASSDNAMSWVGIAPHSVRAVPIGYLETVCEYARHRRLPLHIHMAEQPGEVEACLAEHGVPPVMLLARHGLLDSHLTAVHAIHIGDEDVAALARVRANVCACPTTERNLGDGPLRADRIVDRGIPICLGSDSNIQIDLLEDARELEYNLRMEKLERAVLGHSEEPESLAKRLFEAATENGARSIGASSGILEPRKSADFFTIDLSDPSIAGADPASLLSHVVFSLECSAVRDVHVAGEPVVQARRHAHQDQILRDFADLQRRLWSNRE